LSSVSDAVMLEQADHFARRVAGMADTTEKQIEAAFRLAFARPPTPKEAADAAALLKKVRARYAAERLPPILAGRKALASLCHMLMCANEFLYVG
jgi:hypothetical protein